MNNFEKFLNQLKNLGSSGSQFSINPTITNEQIGNSVQQIQNIGLPTAVIPSPVSPYGINSILQKQEINQVVQEANKRPNAILDFSRMGDSNISWNDMYGLGVPDNKTKGDFSVINRPDIVSANKNKKKGKNDRIDDFYSSYWDKKAEYRDKELGKQQEIMNQVMDKHLQGAMMKKGIDIAGSFGDGMLRGADSLDNATRAIAAMSGSPGELRLASMQYAPMMNYGFVR
tara:strand:- start:637 stop:1323 length:687 start_codon:yes stop_codon:yes gene_type:complete